MLSRKWKLFCANTKGSIGFEAIWAGLVVSFFFAPIAFLFRFSETHLDASWAQRSAARNEALNSNCNGIFFIPIPIGGSTSENSVTAIDCTKQDGEKTRKPNEKFWKKLDTVTHKKFPNFTRDMKNKGDIKVIQGRSTIVHTKYFNLGDSNFSANVIKLPKRSVTFVPSADYYVFDKPVWKKGHDKRIWAEFSPKHRKLFPKVYPSR